MRLRSKSDQYLFVCRTLATSLLISISFSYVIAFCLATATQFLSKNCDINEIFLINKCYNHVPLATRTKKNDYFDVPNSDNRNNNNNDVQSNRLYVLYDVNPVEGFNLRRDVYLRMATFVYSLRKKRKYKGARLVLPPFTSMYHWRSRNLEQEVMFWRHFFDLESLREFTDVVDFPDFLAEIRQLRNTETEPVIDEVYRLQHYDEMFDDGVFRDKFERTNCRDDHERVWEFFGYDNLTYSDYSCVNFQGGAELLRKMLYKLKSVRTRDEHQGQSTRVVLILRTETVLHSYWSTKVYWEARRSMRFSKALTQLADTFRRTFLNSTNETDKVQRPTHWRDEKPYYRGAVGGPYLAAHLRRADFLYGRERTTPSLRSAATQIKSKMRELNLTTVFLASDCTGSEFLDFKNLIRPFRLIKYTPESRAQLHEIKDGGVAIIDQLICAHAQYFIGTYESTFTFRIYEEREIMGFRQETTYNTFCKSEDLKNCEKNTPWTIIY